MKFQILAMTELKTSEVQSSYDRVADEYARHIYDELRHKPMDRQLLDRFADRVRGTGIVCDLGCGPGQVARYLSERKVQICGAIVNLKPTDLVKAMREMHRVLQPGGWLLMSFHIGEEFEHVDDLWDCHVSLDFYFYRPEQVIPDLRSAGFAIEEVIERDPYPPEVEYQSRRAYVFARRPADTTTS